MMRIGRTLRTASRLMRPSQSGFCVFKGYLDPYRHNTMNHNPHNVYIDLWDVGQYPEVVDMSSKPPRTYEPVVVNTFVEVINNAYPGINIDANRLNHESYRPINQLINRLNKSEGSNFSDNLPTLLYVLSRRIIVRESRLTWPLEQKFRFKESLEAFKQISGDMTVREFLDEYNSLIEHLVNVSQFGHSKDIIQPESPLELHYQQEMDDRNQGITDLEADNTENQTLINRIMRVMHS